MPVVNAARHQGISPIIIHPWKNKYRGISLSELKLSNALKGEKVKLNRIMAQQALDNELLREIK
jgi:hypothetical protein